MGSLQRKMMRDAFKSQKILRSKIKAAVKGDEDFETASAEWKKAFATIVADFCMLTNDNERARYCLDFAKKISDARLKALENQHQRRFEAMQEKIDALEKQKPGIILTDGKE